VGHLIPAALALNAGLCDTVLVAYGSNQRTGVGRGEAGRYKMALDPQVFEHPYKPFNPPSSYALATARHMHQYGTTRAQLAEIAVAARQWAQLNPEAFAREPLTVEDVLSSRVIVGLIREQAAAGKAILLSTHALDEIELLCRRIGLIHNGRMIAEGDLTHLRQKAGVNTTSRVKSSRRPSSIAMVHTQVWKSVSTA